MFPGILLLSLLVKSSLGCGYSRTGGNHYPLDVCFFNKEFSVSFYQTCYGQQLFDVIYYPSLNCDGTLYSNASSTMADEYYCDEESCDYIDVVLHEPNQGVGINCDGIGTTSDELGNDAQIINKCLYDPINSLYRLDTCTDTVWTTFSFTDSQCQDINIVDRMNHIDQCNDGDADYIQIAKCSAPINEINDTCGYVQYDKNNWLQPLNVCFIGDGSGSGSMFSCVDNAPYYYAWNANSCNESIAPDVNVSVTPFSFSCSSNICDYAQLKTYTNNNCAQITPTTSFTSMQMITNICYNWFSANQPISSIITCDESIGSITEIIYNTANCDTSFGISTLIWAEDCDLNSTVNYDIECTSLTPTQTPVSSNYTRVIYVTADGSNNFGCGKTAENGCGTLFYATWNSRDESFTEIIVQGQNTKSIIDDIAQQQNTEYRTNPCNVAALYSSHDMTVTFDVNYIHEMKDWYNTELCESFMPSHDFHNFIPNFDIQQITILTINNLIIDSYVFEGRESQPPYIINSQNVVICNYCKFINITIHSKHHTLINESALIVGRDMSFYDCLFTNITYIPSSGQYLGFDVYEYDFTFIRMEVLTFAYFGYLAEAAILAFNFEITNSRISQINMLNSFASLYPSDSSSFGRVLNGTLLNETIRLSTLIRYDIFDDIKVIDAIFYHQPSPGIATLDILETNFFNVNFGSILHSVDATSIISIQNVNISTLQTIEQYITIKETIGRSADDDLYSLLVFEAALDLITINNVNVEYIYMSYLFDHCEIIGYRAANWQELEEFGFEIDFWFLEYFCNVPIRFLDTTSSVYITDLSVRNDINNLQFESARDSLIDGMHTNYGNPLRKIYIDFLYNYDVSDYSFIYNEGTISINSLNVYGAGAHFQIVNSAKGNLFIHEMIAIPETYCIDICNYDSDTLQIHRWVSFGTATKTDICESAAEFKMANSVIYGQKGDAAIIITAGYSSLHNVTIQMALRGIVAAGSELVLSSSLMKDIGSYYGSAHNYLWAAHPGITSFYLNSKNTIIKDTTFSFVDPLQFDMFDPAFSSIYFVDDEMNHVVLIRNIFEINDENVLVPYPFNHSMLYMLHMLGLNLMDINDNQHFVEKGMMIIRDNIDITFINNEFRVNANNLYVNESILIKENIPWIYVKNTNENTYTCISGNIFTNFALWIKKGNVSSCVKSDLMQYFNVDDCESYGTFGAIDISLFGYNDRQRNIFHINSNELSTIIKMEDDTFIALDNTIINVDDLNNKTNIINMEKGNYLFVDTVINASNWDINIGDSCDVNCYSIVNNNSQNITTLHVQCSTPNTNDTESEFRSINDFYTSDTVSHWSPYSIDIFPQNNGEYFPGDRLKFNYSIFDAYNNKIDAIHQEVTINLKSMNETLFAQFPLTIGSDGICKVCESGVLLITATLDLFDNTSSYLLAATVENNELFVNDLITIKIVQCPAGYGGTGNANQCDVCSKGYFSLITSSEPCSYCNENEIEGIECFGSHHIIIDYNYWIVVDTFTDIDVDIFGSEHILSSKCPAAYCCQSQIGCDIIDDSDLLCAENRDFNTYLCGQCILGYSEVFGSTKCMKCDQNYGTRLFLPIIYGFLWAVFILFAKSKKISTNKSAAEKESQSCCKCSKCDTICNCIKSRKDDGLTREEYLTSLEIMVSKIMLYYFQAISYILTTREIQYNLYGFVELCNLNILRFLSVGDGDGYCLFKEMNAAQKISVQLVTTVSILFFIFTAYVCSLCCKKCTKNMDRRGNFPQCFVSAMLICVGQILSVLFQLFACRQITDNVVVHFFFGSRDCYGFIWIASFMALCIVFGSFFALFFSIFIRRKTQLQKDNKNCYYYPAIWCYRGSYWYWELILFVRRSVFAFVFIVFDINILKMTMGILLIIYLYVHVFCLPFKVKDANVFEAYLIGATALIIFIDAGSSDTQFKNVTISILITFPLFWYIYFAISRCKSLMKTDNYKNGNDIRNQNEMGDIELYHNNAEVQLVSTADEDEEDQFTGTNFP